MLRLDVSPDETRTWDLARQQHHRKKIRTNFLSDLARGARFEPSLSHLKREEQRGLIENAHRAHPSILSACNESPLESWADFESLLNGAKLPLRPCTLAFERAASRVEEGEIPSVAQNYYEHAARVLVVANQEMQRMVNELPRSGDVAPTYRLACRDIAGGIQSSIGVELTHGSALNLQKLLIRDGVIECVHPGKPGRAGRAPAAQYRYLHPIED